MSSENDTPDESHKERVDRELSELLQGLRVMVTGVQVLFAFLLTIPFQVGFAKVDAVGGWLFFIALVAAATASICFFTPAVQHRMLFRSAMKERILRRANRLGVVGAVSLALAMTAAVALITEVIVGAWLAVVLGGAVALAAAWFWLIQPATDRPATSPDPENPE